MLRGLKSLERYSVRATDGDIGTVTDFYLDDEQWTVRYLVVRAGGFFREHQVLISPISFRQADWSTQRFHLALTMARIENSPSIDTDLPVARQHERDYYRYYDYPYYWASSGIWGAGAHPDSLAAGGWSDQPEEDHEHRDAHLRSAREVTGYHLHGSDGVIGHVADFLVDDETWEVRYLVVETARWWAEGKEVLVSPYWATSVEWDRREVHVDLSRKAIQTSPVWNETEAIQREYEARLHRHYGRSAYWEDEGLRDERWYSTPPHEHPSP